MRGRKHSLNAVPNSKGECSAVARALMRPCVYVHGYSRAKPVVLGKHDQPTGAFPVFTWSTIPGGKSDYLQLPGGAQVGISTDVVRCLGQAF